MLDTDNRAQPARFGWEDAMPQQQDSLHMLLAKYSRLRFVQQVQHHRLQRRQQGNPLPPGKGVLASHLQPVSNPRSPQEPALPRRDPSVSSNAHQLASDVQSPSAIQAAEQASQAVEGYNDCTTLHHSMLPAPGANILSEAGQAIQGSTSSIAGPASGPDDPIVATVGQPKQQAHQSLPVRRKQGPKTWLTLNLQQAPHASVSSLTAPAKHASFSAPILHDDSQQHHPAAGVEHTDAAMLLHDDTDHSSGFQQGYHQQSQQDYHQQLDRTRKALVQATSGSCLPVGCSLPDGQQFIQPPQAASASSQQYQEAATAAVAASSAEVEQRCVERDHALRCLEGSETQPDLHFAQAAVCTASYGNQHASVSRPSGSATMCPHGLASSQPALLNTQAATPSQPALPSRQPASPAWENIPDSAGNASGPSQAGRQQLDTHQELAATDGSPDTMECTTQDSQGWHLQLSGPVMALFTQGRHVAAFSGSPKTSYQMTVLECAASQAQIVCQTRVHAETLPCEPWHTGSCMHLCTFRDEPVWITSSLIQPVSVNQPSQSGINAWRFQNQQAELACHLATEAAPHCTAVASGLLAAAGEGAWLKLWRLDDQLVCQGQTEMADAKYQRLPFPDITKLAYPDVDCHFIAGCSSTGLLAIWSIRQRMMMSDGTFVVGLEPGIVHFGRGDLLIAHCHPLLMVQSIYQAPDLQLARQAYAPEVFVLLALTRQHPNSQHQGNTPRQHLAALVVTRDNVFVGTSIGPLPEAVSGPPVVAGHLALSTNSGIGSIIWDLQKGETLQDVRSLGGAREFAYGQPGLDGVYVGTSAGRLQYVRRPQALC